MTRQYSRLPPAQIKTRTISIPITEEFEQKLSEAADRKGVTKTSFARLAILTAMETQA